MKSAPQLRVLHLEDSSGDQELVRRALSRDGLTCDFIVARTKAEFEAGLREEPLHLILSDFSIPGYDGLRALAAARAERPEVPFLFVSGTIGEEKAVESLKSGATDYLLKERLERLGAAVRRAVREAEERTGRKRAEAERAALEEQLRQAQKMEILGRLVGGVAHDFNNFLLVIRGYSEMLLLCEEHLSTDGKDWLKQVLSASERASNLAGRLLTFGRKHVMEPRSLDLNALILDLAKMLGRLIGAKVQLRCDCGQGLPPVFADPGMMEQMLMNLVVNARDAMPNGGEVVIETRSVVLGDRDAARRAEARVGEFVCVSVKDTGSGISPELLPRIFEPFFTTKAPGLGTGLGLATVHGIVKQHEGWVEVDSELGTGSVFRAFLPALAAGVGAGTEGAVEAAMPRGAETILLAEDDEWVRRLGVRVLTGLGYKVLEAQSGKAALEVWANEAEKIDLLITDMVMPDGVTGRQLADKLRERKPGLKVIFSSGYSHSVLGEGTDFFLRNTSRFLQKPYSSMALAQMVRRSLDEETKLG